MKKTALILTSLLFFTSCTTTRIKNDSPLKLLMDKAFLNLSGTVKIENVSGYKTETIRNNAENIIIGYENIILLENSRKNVSDYSVFINSVKLSSDYCLNLKLIDNVNKEIIFSDEVFLSENFFHTSKNKKHSPLTELVLIALTGGILFIGTTF